MERKFPFRIIHLFPHSARVAGGHTNAITAIIASQLHRGMDVCGLSPANPYIPPGQNSPIEHLPIQETDFHASDFSEKAMHLAAGRSQPIFHFTGINPFFVRVARQLKQRNIPYVVTSQGQLHFYGAANWLKKFIYLNLISPFVRSAGGLHFTTQYEARRSRYLLPGWRKPVLVLNNLFTVPDPAAISPLSREQFGLPASAFVFVYMGRLHIAQKGLDYLVKAFARIRADKECYLAVIGPDSEGGRAFLEQLVDQLKCRQWVRFLGPQYGENKWRALKLADAFVSPSRWEGFGIAQAEAIGFGVPTLVSTKMNLAPELLKAWAALAEPLSPKLLADAMRRLMEDASLRQSLSECGQKWAKENCSIESAGARFEKFYLELVGESEATAAHRPLSKI